MVLKCYICPLFIFLISQYIHTKDDYVTEVSLSSYFVKAPTVLPSMMRQYRGIWSKITIFDFVHITQSCIDGHGSHVMERIKLLQIASLEQKMMHSHTCEETHTFAQIRWLPSCYRQSRQSVVLQRRDDSAHSFLAEPLLCASHPTDKQDSRPTYLTEPPPLSTAFYFTWGPKHTKLPTLHP